MTLDQYSSLTAKEKKEFSNKFGTYVSMLHLKYGEVVGIQGWDVCFLPEDVLAFEVV